MLAARIDDLDGGDADALMATLNAHFGGDGLAFHAPRPDAWFVLLDQAPSLDDHPAFRRARRNLSVASRRGNDAAQWRRWLDEMQMLLHEHPVNVAREARGRVPVTGIWISDGGRIPEAKRGRRWRCTRLPAQLATSRADWLV